MSTPWGKHMGIFASNFWLWSIVALLGLMFLYTLGALMNLGGFISPLSRASRWLDHAPLGIKVGLFVLLLGLLAYPSFIHRLWADATAQEVRHAFSALPTMPGARAAPPTEQFGGLYDPTGTDGTYIIGWFGSNLPYVEVLAYYDQVLTQRGWRRQESPSPTLRPRESSRAARTEYRDHAEPRSARYELVLAQLPSGSREVPDLVASEPTVFAVRLGVVDPRMTTQVAWFIDCLVHRAPTFPSCEATGWSPLEQSLDPTRRLPVPGA